MDFSLSLLLLAGILLYSHVDLTNSCEIDFHSEGAFFIMLAGRNATILCDATSCLSQDAGVGAFPSTGEDEEGVSLVWTNPSGEQVGRQPNSVFSVPYNQGSMNRLLLVEPGSDVAGYYMCSVMRRNTTITRKVIRVVVLESRLMKKLKPWEQDVSRYSNKRRGDLPPEEDFRLNFRPRRSIDSASFNETASSGTGESTEMPSESVRPSTQPSQKSTLASSTPSESQSSESWAPTTIGSSTGFEESRGESVRYKVENSLASDKGGRYPLERRLSEGLEMKVGDYGEIRAAASKRLMRDAGIEDVSTEEPGYTPQSDEPKETRTLVIIRTSELDQKQTSEPTEEITTSEPTTATEEATATTKSSTALTTLDNVETTPEITTPTKPTSQTDSTSSSGQSGRDDEDTTHGGDSDSGGMTDANKGQPEWCHSEESFFGRHGLAAFAIAIAVALLLVAGLLMVVFMPKLFNVCRRGKATFNNDGGKVAAYRKRPSHLDAEAPMALLPESSAGSPDPETPLQQGDNVNKCFEKDGEGKDEEEGEDRGGTSGGEEEEEEKKPAVSTFLLRQSSQNQTPDNSATKDNGTVDNRLPKDNGAVEPQPAAVAPADITIDLGEGEGSVPTVPMTIEDNRVVTGEGGEDSISSV